MKYLFSLLLLMIAFASCTSNEHKAKKAMERYLSKTLDDYNSYEAVETTELDSAYYDFPEDPRYASMRDSVAREQEALDKQSAYTDSLTHAYIMSGRYNTAKDTLDSMSARGLDMLSHSFDREIKARSRWLLQPREWKGYELEHTYRAKNKLGALELHTKRIVFNKSLDKVIGTEDLK